MNATIVAQDLSVAALTKGLRRDGAHTSRTTIRMTVADWMVMAACAVPLMCGKRLIILDEPTSGLDRFHMEQVGALLRDTARRGAAVLVVTHDEELVAGWCDRVIDLSHVSAPSGVPTASDRRSRPRHAEMLGNRTRYARPYGCVLASR